MLEPIIVVENLHVEMGANPVLRGVDLTVRESEIVAVVGENGSGKSTLLRCLAGLRTPTSGEVTVFGAPPRDDATFWRAVAMIAAEPAWYPGLTVREHVELIRVTHEPVGDAWPGVGEVLERCGLTERADAVPSTLSTGQRQRLSLATALVRPSRLLLLDEPEHGLDTAFRGRLAEILTEYAADGGTIVMATHDPGLIAATGARHNVLSSGRLAAGAAR
ncbi:ABC transporter ATP-binding protein [Microtetraspora sp. AC03309]|uniref:ABC transporter ATP-binding protein n=1 Tax=Microtetraspora sp. AC03309 TaxID=2779376 RepID=UPI001E60FBA2|nr:ABC transporter ATP-binding protein [Microtetraspora sp. AC03309]